MKTSLAGPILKVENLAVKYGAIQALKGLSFEVKKGEIVSLIGANGAGKTTTLKAISGVLPYSGNVAFCCERPEEAPWLQTQFQRAFMKEALEAKKPKGPIERIENLRKVPCHRIVRLGLAHSPEGRGVFPNLTVQENLMMGAYARGDKEEIEKDLANCYKLFPRLKERVKQKAGTLSGGEQQMLAISRALMARPTLLLLDEPSLGLAPLIVAQIFEIIQKLNKQGMTILLVEQNARMALKISHRAYVVETGTITLSGPGKDLLGDKRIIASYLGGH